MVFIIYILIEILYNFCYLQTVETCQPAHTYIHTYYAHTHLSTHIHNFFGSGHAQALEHYITLTHRNTDLLQAHMYTIV